MPFTGNKFLILKLKRPWPHGTFPSCWHCILYAVSLFISYRIVSYCTISYHISHHIICHIIHHITTSHHISYHISHHALYHISYHIIIYHIIYHITSHHITPRHITSQHITSHHIIQKMYQNVQIFGKENRILPPNYDKIVRSFIFVQTINLGKLWLCRKNHIQ